MPSRWSPGAALAGALIISTASPVLAQPAGPPPAASGTATAEIAADRRAANALYKEGVRLFNAGQFAGALELFQNAYQRYPDARILYSQASTLRQLGKTVAAANTYQHYIDDPGAEPQFVAETKTVLHVLDATVGVVELTFEGDPGEIQIGDGLWMPLGTKVVRVEPGSFIVRARRAGATAEMTGQVASGSSTKITVTWTVAPEVKVTPPDKAAKEPDGPARPHPPSHEQASPPYLAYGLGGGGIALGIAAVVLELSSRSKISDARGLCGASLRCGEPMYSQATALLDSAGSRRTGAIVIGALATASLGTGLYLFLHGRTEDHARTDTAVRITPLAGDHGRGVGVGVGIDGSF